MTTLNTAIANHFNIAETAIIKIEEWANVLFTVVKGLGARFVSKKVKPKQEEKQMELPKLEGSEKQVKWANDIRNDILTRIRAEIDHRNERIDQLKEKEILNKRQEKLFNEKFPKQLKQLETLKAAIYQITDAVSFIEGRNVGVMELAEKLEHYKNLTPEILEQTVEELNNNEVTKMEKQHGHSSFGLLETLIN